MSDFYFGRLGDSEWTLLAEKPIVLWTKRDGFQAFDKISDLDGDHYANAGGSPEADTVYFWSNDHWHEVNFILEKGKGKAIEGFCPRKNN